MNLWCTNLWYSVWKRRHLAGDTNRSDKESGWTHAELALCSDYQKFVSVTNETEFHRLIDYLAKAKDIGRKPLPGLVVVLITFLVVAESWGFFYISGSWIPLEGSESIRILLISVIVFVLVTCLVFIMHYAGHQLFRANLIRHCKKMWHAEGYPGTLRTQHVTLHNDQSVDDDQPHYTQCLNRVDGNGSYIGLFIAIVAVVVMVVSLTWMRIEQLRMVRVMDANPFSEHYYEPELGDRFALHCIWSPVFLFIMLLLIMSQLVIIFAGYRWGFSGRLSKEAYKATQGFTEFGKYKAFLAPAINAANTQLRKLHQEMAKRDSNIKILAPKTLADYFSLIARENRQLE